MTPRQWYFDWSRRHVQGKPRRLPGWPNPKMGWEAFAMIMHKKANPCLWDRMATPVRYSHWNWIVCLFFIEKNQTRGVHSCLYRSFTLLLTMNKDKYRYAVRRLPDEILPDNCHHKVLISSRICFPNKPSRVPIWLAVSCHTNQRKPSASACFVIWCAFSDWLVPCSFFFLWIQKFGFVFKWILSDIKFFQIIIQVKKGQVVLFLKKAKSRSWERELAETGIETFVEEDDEWCSCFWGGRYQQPKTFVSGSSKFDTCHPKAFKNCQNNCQVKVKLGSLSASFMLTKSSSLVVDMFKCFWFVCCVMRIKQKFLVQRTANMLCCATQSNWGSGLGTRKFHIRITTDLFPCFCDLNFARYLNQNHHSCFTTTPRKMSLWCAFCFFLPGESNLVTWYHFHPKPCTRGCQATMRQTIFCCLVRKPSANL